MLAPVRAGKTYQCEKYISYTILNDKKKVVVFMTEKNLLVESSYGNILNKNKNNAEQIFIFEKETSQKNLQNLKSFVNLNNNQSIVIFCSHAYFSGERFSELFKEIVKIKTAEYELIALVDEGESFFNSFHTNVIISRHIDKLFKRPCKRNNLIAIDGSRSELMLNVDFSFQKYSQKIRGVFSATLSDGEDFNYFNFNCSDSSTNDDLILEIVVCGQTFTESVLFSNIKSISIANTIFIDDNNN